MRLTTSLLCATLLATACAPATREKSASNRYTVTVTNPLDEEAKATPVVIELDRLKTPQPIKSATLLLGDKEIAGQIDDLDGDGTPDELAFLIDLPARQSVSVKLQLSAQEPQREWQPGVYAEMLLSHPRGKHQPIQSLSVPGGSDVYSLLHHHGPAFESELVGFRTYFDARQSVDIYGKQKRQLELQKTQFYPTPQDVADGYGDDVLWAGSTVGLGSLRGIEGDKLLYIEPVELRTECIRAYGPLRTVVEIEDKNWSYGGSTLNLRARYILYAGHRDVQVQLRFKEPLAKEQFATGLIRLLNAQELNDGKGTAACWGDNFPYGPSGDTIAHPRVTLGLGLYIPQQYVQGTPQNDENLLYLMGNEGGRSIDYHIAFAYRGEADGYRDSHEWFGFVKSWTERLKMRPEVKIEIDR